MALTPVAIYRRLYEGLNYRLRSFAGGRFAHRCRPTSIMFLLTELCNARCVHCDIWKNKGKEDSPSQAQWTQVLDDLRSWLGPVSIVFTGGEALLRPYSTELAAHASSQGFWLEFLTHGYWKDQQRIEQLALARPSRITISVDAVGPVHSAIRGREDFFEQTNRTVETLLRVRSQHKLRYRILLKTVIMAQNLDCLGEVARYATRAGLSVLYQPIEQNYNTADDPGWFLGSPTWPRDSSAAVRAVRELVQLKRSGLHIDNTDEHFEAMIRYFLDPAGLQLLTQDSRSPAEEATLRRPHHASVPEQRRCDDLQSPPSRRQHQGVWDPPDLGAANALLGAGMLSERRHGRPSANAIGNGACDRPTEKLVAGYRPFRLRRQSAAGRRCGDVRARVVRATGRPRLEERPLLSGRSAG
jgi:organic radical activating enzyme